MARRTQKTDQSVSISSDKLEFLCSSQTTMFSTDSKKSSMQLDLAKTSNNSSRLKENISHSGQKLKKCRVLPKTTVTIKAHTALLRLTTCEEIEKIKRSHLIFIISIVLEREDNF